MSSPHYARRPFIRRFLWDFRNVTRQDVDDTFLAFHIVVAQFARCASIPG